MAPMTQTRCVCKQREGFLARRVGSGSGVKSGQVKSGQVKSTVRRARGARKPWSNSGGGVGSESVPGEPRRCVVQLQAQTGERWVY
jgi:hypothetical protein